MPATSTRQLRFMFARHPQIARRWVREAKKAGAPVVQPKSRLGRRLAANAGR